MKNTSEKQAIDEIMNDEMEALAHHIHDLIGECEWESWEHKTSPIYSFGRGYRVIDFLSNRDGDIIRHYTWSGEDIKSQLLPVNCKK